MTRVVVNGTERAQVAEAKTWGEVLDTVDGDLRASGQVVTAIRFDGVEISTYREPTRLETPLVSLSLIEIDAVSTAGLLRQGLSEATGALETLSAAASRIGLGFRGHDIVTANRELVTLAQSLGTLVTLVGVVGQAMNVDFEKFEVSGERAKTLFDQTGDQIGALVQAQQDQDWVAVADTLEYDVSPMLGRWRGLLSALHAQAAAATS